MGDYRTRPRTVAFRAEISRHAKFMEKRRGVRLNSRVPVQIEWQSADRRVHREVAHTRVVAPYGCLVVLPQSLELEQRLRLTNLASGQSNPAVVVWKGKQRTEGWEMGIELIEPEMNFWGLEL